MIKYKQTNPNCQSVDFKSKLPNSITFDVLPKRKTQQRDRDFNSGTKCIQLATPRSQTPALCSQCVAFYARQRKKRLLKVNNKEAVSRAAATESSVPGAVGAFLSTPDGAFHVEGRAKCGTVPR